MSYIQFLKVFLPTYAKLNDYLHKIGVSETSKCSCGEVETIEHYLLHCEKYFNERERMRTVLFQQTLTLEGYPKVRKGVLFAKRTPFREKDLTFTKRTQETCAGLVFTNCVKGEIVYYDLIYYFGAIIQRNLKSTICRKNQVKQKGLAVVFTNRTQETGIGLVFTNCFVGL